MEFSFLSWAGQAFLASLAVYRVARMLPQGEEGPFSVLDRIHAWALDRQDKSWLARGILCMLCSSFWLSLGAAAMIGAPTWQMFILLWLGIAGGAIYWYRRLS